MRGRLFSLGLLGPVLLFAGCRPGKDAQVDDRSAPAVSPVAEIDPGRLESTPLPPLEARATGTPLFTPLDPSETGVDFTNAVSGQDNMPRRSSIGTGVAGGDLDGDGLVDLYFTSQDGPNRLYKQVAPWVFSDVTATAGVDGGEANGTGPALADIDNDGDLDLHVSNQDAPDILYINQGDGTFRNEAEERGLASLEPSVMAAFCDYDRDGDLDVYLLTYKKLGEHALDEGQLQGKRVVPPALRGSYVVEGGQIREVGRRDYLFANDGNGYFTDVSAAAGIPDDKGYGLSATWWDYNGDSWPDLYVANDFRAPDRLFHNRGDGTFEEVTEDVLPFLPWFAMGSDHGDLNNDGLFDIVIGDMMGSTHYRQKLQMGDIADTRDFLSRAVPRQYMRNTLFVNSGAGRFLEASYLAGMAATDWTWAVRVADFDNDGREDVFFANGFYADARDSDRHTARQILKKWQKEERATTRDRFIDYLADQGYEPELFLGDERPPLVQKNLAFRNLGDLAFEDVSDAWGVGVESVSFGAVVCDLDRDGDLDLVTANTGSAAGIFRNDGGAGHRVVVALDGRRSNRRGIGATVAIESEAGRQVRFLSASRGYQGADEPEVHFGLGGDGEIYRLEVTWPSGHHQVFNDLAADYRYRVTEPGGVAPPPSEARAPGSIEPPPEPPRFSSANALFGHRFSHHEQPWDDYRDQPLLPYQLSQLGPGMAWGDFDGDGRDDLWVGGAMGQVGGLFRKEPDGRFWSVTRGWGKEEREDALSEDMGGVWFDADGDGDLDLYAVSGGVEVESGSAVLRDRLYWNQGDGTLKKAGPGVLPDAGHSGGIVSASDFDGDGDVDLFVGSRVIPGRWPESPRSQLLENRGGRFVDVTEAKAPGLATVGLVTGAVWSDVNNDQWPDLMVCLEWGPVHFFQNRGGQLTDRTASSGLGAYSGWWNGIASGDIDNDGDTDFVVTNTGLNTKYQIKEGKPRVVYYADFDSNGRTDVVEAKYEGDALVPVRGKSCSTLAMPALRDKFPTFRKFASATLEDIYSPAGLGAALKREANHLASSVLLNGGGGEFTLVELPREAQIAPAFGVVLEDFDGDGNLDCFLGQNFYPNQVETGWMNMGLSLFLRGNGDGSFAPITALESGVALPGDSRAVTSVDLDGDGWRDVVVATNNGSLEALQNRGGQSRPLAVRLRGAGANPTAIGAVVTLEMASGASQRREVHAGGSYLGQSSAVQNFFVPQGDRVKRLRVRWPHGKERVYVEGFDASELVLEQSTQ